MTRDIGRLAFGMDLQCAQCHDHPLIDDYYQSDYYGLFAFVQRTSLFNDAKNKQMLLGEKADGEASFKSVFTGNAADGVRPQLPKGAVLYVEPTFAKGEEYATAPAKDVRGVPKFSRRAALAGMISESIEFRRNLANRLWAHLFGRGIVHPVDFHHADNPPAHPELLTLLAAELKASGFNLRAMLRELALTRAYQRSCDAPRPEQVNFAEIADRLVKLEAAKAERTAAIEPLAAALAQAKAARKALAEQNAQILAEIAQLEASEKTAAAAADKALAEQKVAADALAKKQEQATLVANAAARTNVAVKKIPDDQAVAQAFALLDERSKALDSRDCRRHDRSGRPGGQECAAGRASEARPRSGCRGPGKAAHGPIAEPGSGGLRRYAPDCRRPLRGCLPERSDRHGSGPRPIQRVGQDGPRQS